MQPLSERTRRLYLLVFVLLFFAMLPAVIFYADGWRYRQGYEFVRTGGIYVAVPYPDATVYFNGVPIGRSGFLERSFYKGDLAPSAYVIHIEREGYRPWDRLLVVEEQLVTDAQALLVPETIEPMRLTIATSTSRASTSTRSVSQALISAYTAVFAATTTASSTIPVDEANGVGLFIDKGRLYARWIQENAFPPSHFCGRPTVCVNEIALEKDLNVATARFFSRGVAYATKDGRVFFKELDVRETPIDIQLFSAKGADIRVIDDVLVIKVGSTFYQITF